MAVPAQQRQYRIGTPGVAWGAPERAEWLAQTAVERSYKSEVLDVMDKLGEEFVVHRYGALSTDPARYPLNAVTSANWSPGKPALLVTGGVHGYEKSGVQGALLFLTTKAALYSEAFNICVVPCVSPWGYETVQRWNPQCKDPNRSFKEGAKTEESSALMAFLDSLDANWCIHTDLHETTDTDETEFMPARAAEKGEFHKICAIPDGFYLVGDSENPCHEFQCAILDAVRKVTHIAPTDADGNIIDEPAVFEGLLVVPAKELGLCCSVTGADFCTTTEVYPDSPRGISEESCNLAQVAVVQSALDFVLSIRPSSLA